MSSFGTAAGLVDDHISELRAQAARGRAGRGRGRDRGPARGGRDRDRRAWAGLRNRVGLTLVEAGLHLLVTAPARDTAGRRCFPG
jgi:hypothetical protein